MNLGIVTSYVIGGILLLSIFMMNFNVSQSTGELAVSRITKQHLTTVSDIISNDFAKIGYNWMGRINDPIETADSTKIVFRSNIDNDPSNTVEKVTWTFGNSGVSNTDNPNDYKLTRLIVQGSTTISKTDISLGVTKFRLKYYDQIGETTPMPIPVSNPQDIKQIEVELMVESSEKYYFTTGSDGRYVKSTWNKRFSPINLQD